MLIFSEKVHEFSDVNHEVQLSFHERQKSRLNVTTSSGESVGIILPRGQELSCGDALRSECGQVLLVQGSSENLSIIKASGQKQALAAYHLGNRHIPAAIFEDEICYQKDHVIDDMMVGLGFPVDHDLRVFTPLKGAYHKH